MRKNIFVVIISLLITSCSNSIFAPASTAMPLPSATPAPIPTDDRVVFNPPIEVELISNTDLDFLLAADTIDYLTDYERNSWRLSYDERVRLNQVYEKGYAYYLSEDSKVLLLEFDGDFAKIKLIEGQHQKKAGNVGWVRRSNLKAH